MLFPLLMAASAVLAWDPNPETDIALYRLYIGIQPITATTPPVSSVPVPWPDTHCQVDGLTYGTPYWFVVTAIDSDGLESACSNEVAYTPMPPPPDPTPAPTPTPVPNHGQGWWHNH